MDRAVKTVRRLLSRSTGLVMSLLAGVTMLALALSVFTLSATSSQASEDAAHLHLADEVLRALDATDAQARQLLLIGLIQAETMADVSASAETSSEQLDLALADARTGLVTLIEVGATRTDLATLDGIAAAMAEIGDRADVTDPGNDLERLRTDVIAPLDGLREAIDDDRDVLIARIERSNGTLRSFATLTGFVVAFVVPTVAVIVHRISTRLPREELRLRGALAVERQQHRDLMSGLDEVLTRDVATPLGDSMSGREERYIDPEVRRANVGIERALLLLRSVDGGLTVHRSSTDLRTVLDEVASPRGVLVDYQANATHVDTDPGLLTFALDELVRNAETHGSQARIVVGEGSGRRVRISVENQGPELPPDVIDTAFTRRDPAARRHARRAARGTGLILVGRIADQLGLHLAHRRLDGRTVIDLEIEAHERVPSLAGP